MTFTHKQTETTDNPGAVPGNAGKVQESNKRNAMKHRRFIVFFIAFTALSSICGCMSHLRVLPEYIPVEEREGRLYCYTRAFVEGTGCQVRFFRQPFELLMPGGNGQWGIHPVTLVVGVAIGVPLALADWFIASPVVDTVLLPYDIKCKFQSKDKEELQQVSPP